MPDLEIILPSGHICIIDKEDYDKIKDRRWRLNSQGYVISGDNKYGIIRLHLLIKECPHGMELDHRDLNKLNNRKENLRIATKQQNLWNRNNYKNSKSKYKGVHWHETLKKWGCKIQINGKSKRKGCYSTEVEAAIAYNKAAIENYGEFARLNIIEE